MGSDVMRFEQIDRAMAATVGGKGANLGELLRIPGIEVPAGFCVTTDAFQRVVAGAPAVAHQIEHLAARGHGGRDQLARRSASVRGAVEALALPDDLRAAVADALAQLGQGSAVAVAVRSSATAEDLPTASSAGQHDSYLEVVGLEAVLDRIRSCWASLFTERAVAYRIRNGIDHRGVQMAVVVQRQLAPQASGVLFTADPVTSNRRVAVVEATEGLGEALVSGRVEPDAVTVRAGEVVGRTASDGRAEPVLTDEQTVRLVALGRKVEAHLGQPQDIEWCLVDGVFHLVQSRPITTLFPIPEVDDGQDHVYISVGHQQMMTDPMKPLGISMWQLTARPPMHEAAGRLFVDAAPHLMTAPGRAAMLDAMGRSDPLIRDALETVLAREGFLPLLPDQPASALPRGVAPVEAETDPAAVTELIDRGDASNAALEVAIADRTGSDLLAFILDDLVELKRILFDDRSHRTYMGAMDATWWLNEHLETWLGERNAADVLTRSVPHNVTSEMGLALLDVADAVRPHPEVLAVLREARDDGFLEQLDQVEGGPEVRVALDGFLARYGMRCVGEIDITRPRWSEHPVALVPVLLGNVSNFAAGEAERRFEQGRAEAAAKEQDLLARLRELPDGQAKAAEAKERIDRVRTFIGYREYPKYFMISRYAIYKRALVGEAERLVAAGVFGHADDLLYLSFPELQDVVRDQQVDLELIEERRRDFRSHRALTPPRVLTSDGECVAGTYRRSGLPQGALAGLAVSAGTVEGRARVIHDMVEADVEPGDILVTTFTDPSWTPLFVSVTGLVTEVGGLMTHGAVIAREYGLPAVVGVERATQRIRDGQRIRVHGTEGFVEILADDPPTA